MLSWSTNTVDVERPLEGQEAAAEEGPKKTKQQHSSWSLLPRWQQQGPKTKQQHSSWNLLPLLPMPHRPMPPLDLGQLEVCRNPNRPHL